MIDVAALFGEQVAKGASDLHLKVGRPPIFRIAGEMTDSEHPVLTSEDMSALLEHMLGHDGCRRLEAEHEVDFAHVVPGVARFRVNVFRHLGQFGVAARAIPLDAPTFDMFQLPPVLKEMLAAPQGLILVTGPTGSGKSTTLACMIEQMNRAEALNIITVEDPVEFVYTDVKCTIRQRQLGIDVASFQEALKRVLRQDPDVILLGEMRDRETIEMAMHAAETGHLVLSTLHTNDAKQTIDRIIDTFPADARDHIRAMLSLTLHAVVSQRLVRRANGKGRVAAMEVLINSPHIRDLIAQNKIREIESAMRSGQHYKMQTFNQALAKLVLDGLVNEADALLASTNANELQQLLRGITGGGGAAAGAAAAPDGRMQVAPLPPIKVRPGDTPPKPIPSPIGPRPSDTPRPMLSPFAHPTPRPQTSPLVAPQPSPPPGVVPGHEDSRNRR